MHDESRAIHVVAPPPLERLLVRFAIVYAVSLIALAVVTRSPGVIANSFTILFVLLALESPKPFEMDAQGIRGGDTGDRMTWPYIERVEMADARPFATHARVVGRYENVVTLHAELRIEGSDVHPADAVRAEAEARGIEVVGRAATRSVLRRTWGLGLLFLLSFALAFWFSTGG